MAHAQRFEGSATGGCPYVGTSRASGCRAQLARGARRVRRRAQHLRTNGSLAVAQAASALDVATSGAASVGSCMFPPRTLFGNDMTSLGRCAPAREGMALGAQGESFGRV